MRRDLRATRYSTLVRTGLLGLGLSVLAGCHLNDVLRVPPPAGTSGAGQVLGSLPGVEATYVGARASLYNSFYGPSNLAVWTGLLGDEYTFSGFTFDGVYADVAARRTALVTGFIEPQDGAWEAVLGARLSLVLTLPGLEAEEPAAGQSKAGEAYALIGYAEVFLAEGFCSGTPLSEVLPTGGVQFGMPLTDDSLLEVAQADFDSALAHAAGNDTVQNLASVGLGRVLLDRGEYDSAATAVMQVPVSFVFKAETGPEYGQGTPNIFEYVVVYGPYGAYFNVADSKGTNGLNFRSANDPRLTFDTTYKTQDGNFGGAVPATWYLPNKFNADLTHIPFATGVEAQLIRAEAALQAGDAATWLGDLNALRNSNTGGCADMTNQSCTLGAGQVTGQTTGLYSLTDPVTDTGRVSLMFRERAFWLYGTGARLGDLRRLVRQYGRDQSTVYPIGVFPNGSNAHLPSPIPSYGTDVTLTTPTPQAIGAGGIAESNPHYKGCLTPTTQA